MCKISSVGLKINLSRLISVNMDVKKGDLKAVIRLVATAEDKKRIQKKKKTKKQLYFRLCCQQISLLEHGSRYSSLTHTLFNQKIDLCPALQVVLLQQYF